PPCLARSQLPAGAGRGRGRGRAPDGRRRSLDLGPDAPGKVTVFPFRRLTAPDIGCDDARPMGAPRHSDRGGGVRRWRVAVAMAATLALMVVQVGAATADPGDQQRLDQLAKDKQDLERAIQVSRQNAERYRLEAGRFQAAVDAANARIADLAG